MVLRRHGKPVYVTKLESGANRTFDDISYNVQVDRREDIEHLP